MRCCSGIRFICVPSSGRSGSQLEQVNLDFFRQTARRQLGMVPEDLVACFQILLQGIWLAAEQTANPMPKRSVCMNSR